MRNLEWMTPDVLSQINQIRFRGNLPDYTLEEITHILQNCEEYPYQYVKTYFS